MPLLAPEVGLQLAHDACAQDHSLEKGTKAHIAVDDEYKLVLSEAVRVLVIEDTGASPGCKFREHGVQSGGNPSIVGNDLQLAPRHVAQSFHLHRQHIIM